jgi:hypothetical protein
MRGISSSTVGWFWILYTSLVLWDALHIYFTLVRIGKVSEVNNYNDSMVRMKSYFHFGVTTIFLGMIGAVLTLVWALFN